MKKQQQTGIDFVVEWNCKASRDVGSDPGEHLSKEDLLTLARALGRMAARRDLVKAREDRARSATTPDVMPAKMPTKTLN